MGWPFIVLVTSLTGLGQRPESLDQGLAQFFELGDLRLLLRERVILSSSTAVTI
jgi:hypothetical protein